MHDKKFIAIQIFLSFITVFSSLASLIFLFFALYQNRVDYNALSLFIDKMGSIWIIGLLLSPLLALLSYFIKKKIELHTLKKTFFDD